LALHAWKKQLPGPGGKNKAINKALQAKRSKHMALHAWKKQLPGRACLEKSNYQGPAG